MIAIRREITIQENGVVEVCAPELHKGDIAQIVVRIKDAESAEPDLSKVQSWRDFIGIFKGDCGSSDNESIDADLAKEYGATHDPAESD